jgi:hypothetical protein
MGGVSLVVADAPEPFVDQRGYIRLILLVFKGRRFNPRYPTVGNDVAGSYPVKDITGCIAAALGTSAEFTGICFFDSVANISYLIKNQIFNNIMNS